MTAADLERVRLTRVRIREGYAIGEVDEFLRKLARHLRAGQTMTADDLTTVTFTPVWLKEGYDMGEVDELLDWAATTLRARGEAGS